MTRYEGTDVDVIVVGGGPVGMAMALDLRARGIDFLLLEAGDLSVDHPKVSSIGPRSMELFRRWGVADRIRNAGWPGDHSLDSVWVTRVGGYELYRLDRGTMAGRSPFRHTPEPDAICPQHWLMPLLSEEIGTYPDGPIRTGTRLTDWTEDDNGVVVTMQHEATGRTSTAFARYLVACDGAHSWIRATSGIDLERLHRTRTFRNILFRAPQLREQLGSRSAMFYYLMLSSQLRFPMRALDGQELYRLTVGVDPDAEEPPAAELLDRAIAPDTPVTVLSDNRWHLVHQVAERFRSGRMFLVGDAAHTLSPSGGFGMNTGICGAADLGWKLEAQLSGWAGPDLLDTYETERRPVALEGLAEANRNLERTMRREVPEQLHHDDADGERAREAMAERLANSGVAQEFDAPLIHLGFRYSSPIVATDPNDPAPGEVTGPSSAPGSRAPHAWIRPGVSTLDLLGSGFRLFCFAESDQLDGFDRAFRERGVPFASERFSDDEVAAVYERPFVLVRPDGHVAWRGKELPADPAALADQVRGMP